MTVLSLLEAETPLYVKQGDVVFAMVVAHALVGVWGSCGAHVLCGGRSECA